MFFLRLKAMHNIVIVNNPEDWTLETAVTVLSAKQYITDKSLTDSRHTRIFNLCRSYRYQSMGYYVSLLAEARGHKAIPAISTIQDFKSQTIIRSISDELDSLFQKSFKRIKSDRFTLSIYFGRNFSRQYDELARQLYSLFQSPLLRAQFVYDDKDDKWILQNISPIQLKEIPEDQREFVEECAREYFSKKRHESRKIANPIYDLAILVDPEEHEPPSNKQALANFVTAAEKEDIHVEIITEDDYDRIEEFDALFIRTTTSVDHYTYRFARRALTEGIAVIDDPDSILRCSNKVYLAELLTKAKLPTPKTMIVHKQNADQVEAEVGLPCVLKQPDGSFSIGMRKVHDATELQNALKEMFEESDLIIAQSFTPTEFDWRVGVLDGKPLYACKYFMAKGHWQIYNWANTEKSDGKHQTVPIAEVPKAVLNAALDATKLIGNGLYGVDLKQFGDEVTIIEVNDNPNIDNRVEDQVLKQELYERVIASFTQRVKTLQSQKEVSI